MEKEQYKIITTEDGRGLIRDAINSIMNPKKISAPFGYSKKLPLNKNTKIMLQQSKDTPLLPCIAKYSKSIHYKLIIGSMADDIPAAIIGSCNFTENSIENMHEIIMITTKEKDVEKLDKLFDRIWNRL